MIDPSPARRGAVLAAAALSAAVLSCATAGSAGAASPDSPASAATPASVATPDSVATPAEPSPGGSASPSVPSAADVAKAKAAADAAAKEVAEITAKVAGAQAQLEKLQRAVADAVTGHERAEQQLADAEAAVRKATADVAAARRAREQAERALSGEAALMYMQGGDLQHMPTLLLSPANTMSDLTVVLDQSSRRVQDSLETATSAAVRAAATERVLVSVRADRDTAAAAAATKRAAAEKEAATAGAEAARLGQQQEALTARLAELNQGAEDLAGQREAAARLSRDLLGRQAAGGAGPRAAQEIARSKMASHGWDGAEFPCLVALWTAESGWSWSATNPSSGAYGIPQSLPGWKMASAGSDWLTNPATQITWGMGYIKDRYGSPCNAYDAFQSRSPHWY